MSEERTDEERETCKMEENESTAVKGEVWKKKVKREGRG